MLGAPVSTALISAVIGAWEYSSCWSHWTVRAITHALKLLFALLAKQKSWIFLCFDLKKSLSSYMPQILLKLWLTGNWTSYRPIRSVITLVIKQIGLPLRGRLILLTSRMITDRIGLNSMLLSLLICCWKIGMWNITIFLMT